MNRLQGPCQVAKIHMQPFPSAARLFMRVASTGEEPRPVKWAEYKVSKYSRPLKARHFRTGVKKIWLSSVDSPDLSSDINTLIMVRISSFVAVAAVSFSSVRAADLDVNDDGEVPYNSDSKYPNDALIYYSFHQESRFVPRSKYGPLLQRKQYRGNTGCPSRSILLVSRRSHVRHFNQVLAVDRRRQVELTREQGTPISDG